MIFHTFKPGIAYGLSTEALHILDPINYNRSTQNVCKGKHMELFKTGSWLTGKREKSSPVFFPLPFLKTELKQLGLDCLIFLPARVKPANSNGLLICTNLNVIQCRKLLITSGGFLLHVQIWDEQHRGVRDLTNTVTVGQNQIDLFYIFFISLLMQSLATKTV
jgi:hypothetical protein